jgi:hypothetical protein
MALELRNRLERALALKLSATLVWNYPTVSAMAAHLEGRITAIHERAQEVNGQSARTPETEPLPKQQAEAGSRSAAELLELELLGAQSLLQE